MLTVSVPTRGTPPRLLARAVDGLLAQTVPLRVVVVADGVPATGVPDDPRVTVLNLSTGMGRYYADAVVLTACNTGWFAVHDADDHADPELYEALIDAARDGAAAGAFCRHELGRDPIVQQPAADVRGYRHLWHWCAAVTTVERARRAGGVHPGFRLGYDTLFTLMVALTGPVGVDPVARWHWHRRDGTLSTAPDTRLGSVARAGEKARAQAIYRRALRLTRDGQDPGDAVRDDIPADLAAMVDADADRLRALLDTRVPA